MKYLFLSFDGVIFGFALILTLFGVLMVYDASSATALREFNDKFFFIKDQAKWAAIGITLAVVVSRLDYRRLFRFSPYMLLLTIVLLVLVFLPGIGLRAYGASRWINFRLFVLQPSELAKLVFIIYLSAWFSTRDRQMLFSFVVLTATIVGLVLLQPDMGTAVILAVSGVVMFYLSNGRTWQLIAICLSIVPIGVFLAIQSPYRLKRLTTFLNPDSDPLGASYHIRQALLALGSGGIWGLGLGNSRQKYSYLPEATTDSIFAIIGEELGLFGVVLFLLFLMIFISRGFKAAIAINDSFGQLLVAGIISWLAAQTLLNLAAIVALVPLTGVPLPFISYGGSALVAQWLGIGIILSVIRLSKIK